MGQTDANYSQPTAVRPEETRLDMTATPPASTVQRPALTRRESAGIEDQGVGSGR